MKIELICEFCGGKRFFNRSSSTRMGWKKEEIIRTKSAKNYECKRCGNWIRIENNEWRATPEMLRKKTCKTGKEKHG